MSSTLRERQAYATGFAVRQLTAWRYWAVIAGATLFLTAIGPFGTMGDASFWPRLVYWASTMVATSVVAIVVIAVVTALAPPEWRLRFPVLMGAALVSCLPNTLVVMVLIELLLRSEPPTFWQTLPSVIPIGMAVGTISWLVFERVAAGSPETCDGPERPNPLMERLPVEKRGPVIRMSMQDHYVEVVTTKGRELVLMRMTDAEAAMGEAGLRIHRSHWVGREHVAATRRDGGGAVVTTSAGEELPVSRSYLAGLREAGLLPG